MANLDDTFDVEITKYFDERNAEELRRRNENPWTNVEAGMSPEANNQVDAQVCYRGGEILPDVGFKQGEEVWVPRELEGVIDIDTFDDDSQSVELSNSVWKNEETTREVSEVLGNLDENDDEVEILSVEGETVYDAYFEEDLIDMESASGDRVERSLVQIGEGVEVNLSDSEDNLKAAWTDKQKADEALFQDFLVRMRTGRKRKADELASDELEKNETGVIKKKSITSKFTSSSASKSPVEKSRTINVETMYEATLLEDKNFYDTIFTQRWNVIIDPKFTNSVVNDSEVYGLVICDVLRKSKLMEKCVKIGCKLNDYNQQYGGNEFSLRYMLPSQITPDVCNLQLDSRLQSNTDKRPSYKGKFHLQIQAHKIMGGSGKPLREVVNRQLILHGDQVINRNGKLVNQRNFVAPNKASTHCLGVAVLQGMLYHEKSAMKDKTSTAYKRVCLSLSAALSINSSYPKRSKKEWERAKNILLDAGITQSTNFSIEQDLPKLQNKYPQFKFVVVRDGRRARPVFNGELSPMILNVPIHRHEIPLLLKEEHYSFVRSLAAYFDTKYYCTDCGVRYNNVKSHYNCVNKCTMCLSPECKTKEPGFDRLAETIPCPSCDKLFVDTDCYNRHLEKGPLDGRSRCESVLKCPRCECRYYDTYAHICGEKYCSRCQCSRKPDHFCTMAVKKPRKRESHYKRIFFDLETESIDTPAGMQHKVVNVFTIKSCRHCSDTLPEILSSGDLPPCDVCSPEDSRVQEFQRYQPGCQDNDVMAEFMNYLLDEKHTGFTAIAHNLKGYDGQFILKELDKTPGLKPEVLIMNGRKLMGMELGGVKLIDSLSYIQSPLKKFPSTFGFEDLMAKGDFPHLFNRQCNFSYKGVIPDLEFFMPNRLGCAEKEELRIWHEEQVASGYVWDFQEELRRYTMLDTAILAIAMMSFERETYQSTGVTLFEDSWTAASAAMMCFRMNHLKANTMALDPSPRHSNINQSVLAIRHLDYLAKEWGLDIKHKFNGGEKVLPKSKSHGHIFVDGYIAPCNEYKRGLAIEIKGCYFHACPCKYEASEVIRDGLTAQCIRDRDLRRETEIQKHMDLKIIYEHDIRKEMKTNPEFAAAMNRAYVPGPIDLRSALFGGRTECVRLLAEADIHTILEYLDVTSLYPYVMKYKEFMVGPSIYIHPEKMNVPIRKGDDLGVKGLICCDLAPPVGNDSDDTGFVPVIPLRRDDKLLFTLCAECNSSEKCTHSYDERKIHGTYTHIEIERALNAGYVLTAAYGALHWEEWVRYSNSWRFPTAGVFSGYVDMFLKSKLEASGYPADYDATEELKDLYIQNIYDNEGIRLTKENIKLNHVKRAVSKMFLNSLWGKFAERKGRQSHHYIDGAEDFLELLVDKTREVKDILELSENRVLVIMDSIPGYEEPGQTSTLPYAIFTTSYARDYLYEMLKAVPSEDLIYMDTDSIVMKRSPDEQHPLADYIGPGLGQLTSEIPTGWTMKSFCSVGPKTYSYQLEDKSGKIKMITKTKGFKKSSEAETKLTFDLMERQVKQFLNGEEPETMVINYDTIVRDRAHNLYSKTEQKQFSFTHSKRAFLKDGSSRPFGFYV